MSERATADLPEPLCEIAEIAGFEAARKLAWGYGGRIVHIPAEAPTGHWLVDCVGRVAADAICRHYRILDPNGRPCGIRLQIPMAGTGVLQRSRQRLARLIADGALSPPSAARLCGMHERTAWRIKAKLHKSGDDSQGDLFEP